MFEEIEFNPKYLLLSILGAGIAVFTMKNVQIGIFWKILSIVLAPVLIYLYLTMSERR